MALRKNNQKNYSCPEMRKKGLIEQIPLINSAFILLPRKSSMMKLAYSLLSGQFPMKIRRNPSPDHSKGSFMKIDPDGLNRGRTTYIERLGTEFADLHVQSKDSDTLILTAERLFS